MEDIITKTDDIIKKLEDTKEIKEMYNLKKIIKSDKNINSLLMEFEQASDNIEELKQAKIKLYNNPEIKKYLTIQNELDYLIMNLNKKISCLLNDKDCTKHII